MSNHYRANLEIKIYQDTQNILDKIPRCANCQLYLQLCDGFLEESNWILGYIIGPDKEWLFKYGARIGYTYSCCDCIRAGRKGP